MGKQPFLNSLFAWAFNSPVISQAGVMSVSEEWNAGLKKKKKKLPIGALPWELLAQSVMRSSLEFGPAPNQSLGISVLFIFPGQPALLVTAFT